MIMLGGHLLLHTSPAFLISKPTLKLSSRLNFDCINNYHKPCTTSPTPTFNWPNNLISVALAVALVAPLPSSAIPFSNSKSSSATTPFSQAKDLPTGLENGKIRPCPSINPGCVSSNPKSSNFSFPWMIVGYTSDSAAIQKLQDAILKTQKNAKIQLVQDTPSGKYLQAEIDGGFGRDVMEFLVNGDVVSYRSMATKVTYVYPFTTALGDSKGQEARLKQVIDEIGWYAPSFESMD